MAGKKKEETSVQLSEIERSALGEICDLISSSISKTFSNLLASDVGMTPSEVVSVDFDQLKTLISTPVLLAQLTCSSSLNGQFYLFINGEGLPHVFDLAIPEDAKDVGADDEVILEEVGKIINQAVSEAMANFAASMGHVIDCSVVDVVVIQDESGLDGISYLYPEGSLLLASTTFDLQDTNVSIGYLLPITLSNTLIDLLLSEDTSSYSTASASEASTLLSDPEQNNMRSAGMDFAQPSSLSHSTDIQPASFGSISSAGSNGGTEMPSNISLLLDVTLDASIELGKTQMTIEEILQLTKGSVIELDKLASEPVEFLVNGKVIARGEVVVIDDNFGIRITEILSPRARLESI